MPDTPYSILENQQRQLQRFYTDREQKLRIRRLPKAQHNAELANLQSAYDAGKFKISSTRSQLDNIRRSRVDSTLRDEAMWKLVAPEQAAIRFPTIKKPPAERVPISPTALKPHLEMMAEFAEAAPSVGEWFTTVKMEPRSQINLVQQYLGWREAIGYGGYQPRQQRQLDIQWDDLMKNRPKYEWDPASPQIKALRTYGGRITGIAAKKISPLARSIAKEVPSKAEQRRWALGKFVHPLRAGPMPESRVLDVDTAGAILREAGGDKEKARQIAKRRGYIL